MTKLFDDSARIVCKLPVHVCVLCVVIHVCVLCVCMWLLIYVYCVYLSNQFWSCTKVLWPYVFNSKSLSFYTLLYFEHTQLYKGNYTEITDSFSTKILSSIAELHGHLHTFINLINLHIVIKDIYFKMCTKMPASYERNISWFTGCVCELLYHNCPILSSIFKVTTLL